MSKKICSHLASRIGHWPQEAALSKATMVEAQAEARSDALYDIPAGEFELMCRGVEERLHMIGLKSHEVTLLMDRFVSQLTLKEIAEKHGYISPSAAQYLISLTLKTCRNAEGVIRQALKGSVA